MTKADFPTPLNDADLEFFRLMVDFRFKGISPQWIYVFTGAWLHDKDSWMSTVRENVKHEYWPLSVHFGPVERSSDYISDTKNWLRDIENGRKWWEQFK